MESTRWQPVCSKLRRRGFRERLSQTAKRLAYLKLMEKNQNTDPFKFIIYSGRIREQTPQINAQQ